MFRIVSIAGFVLTFVGIGLHCAFFRPKLNNLFAKERQAPILDGLRIVVHLLTLLLPEQRFGISHILRKLLYVLVLLCFVVLLVTGFFPMLILGKSISGYWLMLHVTAGGVFSCSLTALACFWADNCRFDKNDCPWLQRLLQREGANKTAGEKYEFGQKICFWLIILLALPLILSVVLSMFPLFGTEGQECLSQLHRYSALLLSLVAIVHTYLIIRIQC
ncbi:MAG: cytochrome b/b6 domain-containing protein [Planctomycetota bacterium]|jgi:cytochrome b subunit of formate dehydrogenase